jgi:hypothetical protein
VRTTVVAVEERFVSGESSAAVRASEGAAALPVFSLTRTSAGGVNGRPTLVSNVETLAQLALLARLGVDGYSAVGTADEPGTTLLTVHRDRRPDVIEVAHGTPLSTVLDRSEVGPGLLVGGYHGSWVPVARFDEVTLSVRGFQAVGAGLGAGLLVPLPPGSCPLAEESAGQCAVRAWTAWLRSPTGWRRPPRPVRALFGRLRPDRAGVAAGVLPQTNARFHQGDFGAGQRGVPNGFKSPLGHQ